ncbi:MAG: CoB--CoM heterodisulfide reductase iron-sulfur subunit A family protein [Ardenticatenaceae bacterium]|nr:CoB--CoM heterodisulfide reductase iron-sulfur subunit A family protein [Ardenticatenaceae bacterium]
MSEKNEEARIGVYTCHCGGNISDVVRCEQVASALRKLPNVLVSRTDMSMCSDAGQAMVEADIKEHGLNRIVIGACSPSLHEQTFRGTVSRAGLNPYLYHHVGIREQNSWVHKDDPDGATQKAVRLMAAGIAKARLLESLEPIRLSAEKQALVIGGGIAGLRSTWDLARRGLKVVLIEKTPFLGGHMAQLESVFPTEEAARDLLHDLIEKVTVHPNVTVHTRAELVGMSGYVGDYKATIRQQSRGIADGDIGKGFTAVQRAIINCPVEVPDEFNYGLTQRKAIYQAYPGCYPATPAIDWEHCNGCRECLKNLNGDTGLIDLENEPREFELTVGAVVVATGFKPYEPHFGEYNYGVFPEVVTLPKFIRLLALTEEGQSLQWNGRTVRKLAFIHCVGSRQLDGINEPQADGRINDYCSRICCTATLHTANEVRERFPNMHVFDLYEDIRTYGRGHEEYYTRASKNMVRFVRFHDDDLPGVLGPSSENGHALLIPVHDYLTWGEEIEIPVDMVVLVTGIMPNPVDDIIRLLKIAPGTDRFLLEVHPKLRPVETAVPGVILAGTAQGPMNIQESCAAASAAAAKVAVLLGQGRVELEPFVAHVDPARCNGSGECVAVCPYEDAITLETVDGVTRAVVTPANCAGCGSCVSACPNRAIDLQGWTLDQYDAMVDAIASDNLPMMEVAV